MKKRLKSKKSISILSALAAGFLGLGMTAAGIAYSINNKNIIEKVVPPEWLNVSEDGKTLYGFVDDVTINDLSEGHYTTLEIPQGVETIESYAFSYMFSVQSTHINTVQLPESLKTIKDGAFVDCQGLETIIFEDKETRKSSLEYIGKDAFRKCGLIGSLEIPKTVETIGNSAFENCPIRMVHLPQSIVNMGARVFCNCTQLSSIDLSEYVKMPTWIWHNLQIFLGAGTFATASNHITVCLDDSTIGEWSEALYNRQLLPRIGESEHGYSINIARYLEEKYFDIDQDEHVLNGFTDDVPSLWEYSAIKIPDSVTKIAKNAFYDEDNEKGKITNCHVSLELGAGVEIIEEGAFRKCTGIKHINMEDSFLSEINKEAFLGCTGITGDLVIGLFVSLIGSSAFQDCTNITRLIFRSDAENMQMDDAAFAGCSNLCDIDISQAENAPQDWYDKEDEKTLPFDSIAKYGNVHVKHGSGVLWADRFVRWGIKNFKEENPVLKSDNTFWWVDDNDQSQVLGDGLFYFAYDGTLLAGLNEKGKQDKQLYQNFKLNKNVQLITSDAFKEEFTKFEITQNVYSYWDIELVPGLIEIQSSAFEKCDGLVGYFHLPRTLEIIGDKAFSECSYWRGILSFPQGLKQIGRSAFAKSNFLYSDNLIIPNSVEFIGLHAFQTLNITQITIKNGNLKEIEQNAFDSIIGLETLDLTEWTLEQFQTIKLSNQSFYFNIGSGKVLISSAASDQELEEWTSFLRSKGLPASWTVQREVI